MDDELMKENQIEEENLEEVSGGAGILVDKAVKSLSRYATHKGRFMYCNYCNRKFYVELKDLAGLKIHLKSAHDVKF